MEETPIEFIHTITDSEVKSTYINLKDDEGKLHGEYFPPHRTKLTIIDEEGRRFYASKHHTSQVWGNIRAWFKENQILPGTRILIH